MDGMKKHLLRQSEPSKFTFVGEEVNGRFHPKMVNNTCLTFPLLHFNTFYVYRITWCVLLLVLWH